MIDAEILGKLQLSDDDVLGIQLSTEMSFISVEQLDDLRETLQAWLPTGRILILPPRAALYTASREELKARVMSVIAGGVSAGPDVLADAILESLQGAQLCRVCGYARTCGDPPGEDCHS